MTSRYARPDNFGHPIRNPLIRKHFVYRLYATSGELIYVGCTQDVRKRLMVHSSQSRWWPLADGHIKLSGPYNYEVARQVEYDAIESERPRANFTSERRALVRIRDRMVKAYIELHPPMDPRDTNRFMDAYDAAAAAVDAVLPDLTDEPLNDLSVANARRIEAGFVRALRESA